MLVEDHLVRMSPVDFLSQLQVSRPDLAPDVAELADLYQRKLWHQLTLKLEECFSKPIFNQGDLPVQIYNNFIADFAHKLNLLKLAHLAVHVCKYFPDDMSGVEFLESVILKLKDMKLPHSSEPILFLKMHVAERKLELGELQECKSMIEAGRQELEEFAEADPSISAAVYYVSSRYHKLKKDFAEFYKTSLMYLSYVSSDSLVLDFKVALAVDIGLAALLGDQVYNFGQLLLHPIVKVLHGTQFQWLGEMLECFNRGDLHEYDNLCSKYAEVLNKQPALVVNERKLREKITLMCLTELVSNTPAEDRNIALAVIAQKTKLDIDGVEFLLMKALALHLIEGVIDQVDGIVQISWVQPRVVTIPQIQGLSERLDTWIEKVNQISDQLEKESIGVVEAAN